MEGEALVAMHDGPDLAAEVHRLGSDALRATTGDDLERAAALLRLEARRFVVHAEAATGHTRAVYRRAAQSYNQAAAELQPPREP